MEQNYAHAMCAVFGAGEFATEFAIILRQDSAESTSTFSGDFLFPSHPPDIWVIILAFIIHASGERDYF